MATLTYDPTPADQPEFSAEEQESIEIGEKLEQQQNNLLAGKYQNAQELEKAYVELQAKIGQQSQEEQEEEQPEPEAEPESEPEAKQEEDSSDEEEYTLTAEDVDALMNVVGGKDNYNEMLKWAGENLSETEIKMFDHVVGKNDPFAMFFAIRALGNSWQNAVGVDGELLTGSAPTDSKDVFRSQAEVIEAMSDPRYDKDPAYRNDVFEKLDRSNVAF